MYFTVTCDTEHVERMLQHVIFQVKTINRQMKEQFQEWETNDMHRKHAHSKFSNRLRRVGTRIYPRGRHHYKPLALRKHDYPLHRKRGHHRRWSTRPILRPELFELWRTRMLGLLREISWSKAKGGDRPSGAGSMGSIAAQE